MPFPAFGQTPHDCPMDAELLWVFAVASLAGGITQALGGDGRWITISLTGLGIVAILSGVIQLIRESRFLLDVFQSHIEELERR
jgi:hypothetical protein